MARSKKRKDNLALGIARVGHHYRIRDKAVGVSPRLTDIDKRNALFSLLAYNTGSEAAIKNKLNASYPEWELASTSNEESVFVNRLEKKMVFAAKGTNPSSIKDLKSDLKLTAKSIRKWGSIPRMEESLKRYRHYKNVHASRGIEDFSATGHSLGGGVALHIAKNTGDRAVVFNPSLPVTRAMDKVSIPNSRIIRTNYDVVSRGRTAVVDGERITVPVSDGVRNPISAHKMDHFLDVSITATRAPSLTEKASMIYDEHAPKAFGALTAVLTTAQLLGDVQDRDLGSFVKHSAEAVIFANPVGAIGVTAFELGSSVVGDIRSGDTGRAIKDTIEGAALSGGAVFGVPGLVIGGVVAGATEIGYRILGHSHPRKPASESISGAVTEPGLSFDHLGRTYADSLSGKADAVAARGVLRG